MCRLPGTQGFAARCTKGRCELVDMEIAAYSGCDAHADCTIRPSYQCDCSSYAVAVSRQGAAAFQAEVIGSAQCAECPAASYAGLSTTCKQGRCRLEGEVRR